MSEKSESEGLSHCNKQRALNPTEALDKDACAFAIIVMVKFNGFSLY